MFPLNLSILEDQNYFSFMPIMFLSNLSIFGRSNFIFLFMPIMSPVWDQIFFSCQLCAPFLGSDFLFMPIISLQNCNFFGIHFLFHANYVPFQIVNFFGIKFSFHANCIPFKIVKICWDIAIFFWSISFSCHNYVPFQIVKFLGIPMFFMTITYMSKLSISWD